MEKIVFALPLISILITFLIGFFILMQDRVKEINRYFFLMVMFLVLWMTFNFLEDVSFLSLLSKRMVQLDFFFAPVAAYFFYLFCQVLPRQNWRNLSERVTVFIIVLILSIVPFFDSILINSVVFDSGSKISFTPLILLYGIVLAFVLLGSCLIILQNFKKSTGIEKTQTLYLLIGFFILTISVLISNLILPNIISSSLISRFGFVGVIAFITLCSYSILKHHLFDVRVILTELAAAIVVFALLLQVILSETTAQGITSSIILILVAYGGYLLIKSVQEEIKKKEQLQTLTMQLGQANSHLQELDKMKTEFVSLASHELLTPVSAIEGYLSMILDEKIVKIEDPKANQFLDRVYRSAKRLARLVADMLNISRIEEGRLLVQKANVNLNDMVTQVIEEIKFKADEHKQKVVFANPDHWQTFGDPDKIKEVLVNLIGNSIKYSKDPGTITVSIERVPTKTLQDSWGQLEAEMRSRPLDDQEGIKSVVDPHLRDFVGAEQLEIKVMDQGIGIPKAELPRLFTKFHRVGDFSTAESQGTGLGLYISRALVELHHGRIWADSEGQGKGSTFTFTLPDIKAKDELLKMEAAMPQTKEQLKPLAKPMKAAEDI